MFPDAEVRIPPPKLRVLANSDSKCRGSNPPAPASKSGHHPAKGEVRPKPRRPLHSDCSWALSLRNMIHCRVMESSEAWAPCYIGFCPGSPPTSLSWSQPAFVSGRGVGVCLDVAEAGGAIRANGSLAAGRGLTRAEACPYHKPKTADRDRSSMALS